MFLNGAAIHNGGHKWQVNMWCEVHDIRYFGSSATVFRLKECLILQARDS